MGRTAADVLMDTLHDYGVEVVFGLPGDGINGLMEALRQRQDKIRFVQTRHGESAAFMACAYAKYTGKLGVCLASSGPGAIHLLNGLYDAKMDGQPVLAITGHHYHDLINTHAQQDVDITRIFEDVAVYNTRVMGKTHVEPVGNLACRTAIARRGVAHINFPVDFQEMEMENPSKRNVQGHAQRAVAFRGGLPADEDLHEAAAVLNKGKRIAILAGRGAIGATDELEELAETLGAPIAKALLGKACVPDDSPYTIGSVGMLGTKPSQEAMEDCDTLFMIGTSFPLIEFLPQPGQARAVQLDIDPVRIGLRYPIDVGLVGDTRRTLRKLLPMLKRNRHRNFLKDAQKGMSKWWDLMEERGTRTDTPMKPQQLAWELGRRLSEDAIVSCEAGTVVMWWARQIPARRHQMHSLSGNLATMASGLPYAIAAQIAYPGRQCVAFVGDGGFTMLMGELATAVKYKLPIKVIIVKNNTLGQVKWEQMVFLGNPEYGCELQPIDFAQAARAMGATGITLEDPRKCGDVLDAALATPGPVVVEAVVDPFVPPMPANIKASQAKKFGEALSKGQPHRGKIARTTAYDKIREMI